MVVLLIESFGLDVRSLLWCLFSCKVNLLGSCFWSIYTVQTEIHPCFADESSALDALHTLADLSVNILQPSSVVESG